MTDDIGDISAYYNSSAESEHNRLERHPLEFDITWRYLERCLPAHGSILEIGAATGRYTLPLARRGYQLTAADLSPVELGMNRAALAAGDLGGQARFLVADARGLPIARGMLYDAVLLMGPLYHLVVEGDRQLAVREAYRLLRPGGRIFSAFISRFGVLGDLLAKMPEWIDDPAEVQSFIERGQRPEGAPRGGFRGYFATLGEIAPLHESVGFETLLLAGVEPGISSDDASYDRLEGARRRRWLDLLDRASAEPTIAASSRHMLYIGKKPESP